MINRQFDLMPPAPHLCQVCAVEHDPEQPHNAQTFFYKFCFASKFKRAVTWADAMAHCPTEVQEFWTAHLESVGVDINSPQLTGDITTDEELKRRMEAAKNE